MLSQNMSRKLAAIQNTTPEQLYRDIAETRQAKRSQSHIEVLLTFGAVGLGYSFAAMAGAVGAGALGMAFIAYKWWDAFENLNELENGDLNTVKKFLSPHERKRLEADLKEYGQDEAADDPSDIDEPALPGATMPPWAKDWNTTQKQLWDKLIKDCPQMTLPIFSKLVVVSGPQQTGKSSLASAIAYCRFILRGDPTIAVTPHVDGKKMFSGLLVGAGGDFEEIQAWYEDLVSKFEMGGDRRTILIDELSQYTGDWEKLGQNIVRTALTESDKHGYSPILINHAQTVSAGFSGIPGVKALIDSSAIRILRQYHLTDWGEQTRSNTITMELPDGKKLSSTVPDWFHLPTLQKMFPVSLPQHQEAPEWLEQEIVQSGQVDEVAKLNKLLQSPSEPNPFDAKYLTETPSEFESLPYDLKAIANYAAKQNGWIKARDIQRNVTGFNGYSATQIRMWFCDLSRLGVGSVDGDEHTLKYRV